MTYINKNSADDDSSQINSGDENSEMGCTFYMWKQYWYNAKTVSDLFSKCYESLGCLDTDARWYDKKNRPVNLRPADRHIIKTDFLIIKPNREVS